MWSFRRKKAQESNLPAEISEYYQAENKSRLNRAWVLSVVTFLVTTLIVLGLFFGGRWIYERFISGDSENGTPTVVEPQPEEEESAAPSDRDNGNGRDNGSDAQVSPRPEESTPESDTETEQDAATGEVPRTGPRQPQQIPQTGPSNN